jgi:catabolite regulation protein CreA
MTCTIDPVGECKDTDPDACECCAAANCEAEGTACCNEPGCRAIVDCVLDTDCEGLACYNSSTCRAEIDAAGGLFGDALSAAQALGDCVEVPCAGCSTM